MTGRIVSGLRLSPILIVLALGACGGGGGEAVPTVTVPTTTAPAEKTAVRAYFLLDGKVWPFAREVEKTGAVAAAALGELIMGPSPVESRDLEVTSSVPADLEFSGLAVSDGVARVELSDDLSRPALAQVVHTLTQFPTVEAVEIDGKRYTRAGVEAFAPSILVESPLPFEHVSSPLRARGTANTFEATFEYELTDPEGKVIADHFVTATSGSGTRGTFEFKVPFKVDRAGVGALIVFERSAEDGSRIHEVEIPIYLES